MTYASIALALLKIVSMLLEYINNKKAFDAGVDAEITKTTLSILKKTQAGKKITEQINAMDDSQVDAGLRGLEPRA